MKLKIFILFCATFGAFYSTFGISRYHAVGNAPSKTVKVTNATELKTAIKTALPGDSIIMANGKWLDIDLLFSANGEAGKYVYLVAETPGKVIISGKSSLRIAGRWLFVSGLVFKDGYSPRMSVIQFRADSKKLAHNSVVSNCVIDGFNRPDKDTVEHWVDIYGKDNSLQYCYLANKRTFGTTVVMWPTDSTTNNNNRLFRNYFGYRTRLGSNGGETIRIGTSTVSHLNSGSIVEENYFEHCSGETEIISSKSGNNLFKNNTFFECEGSLVLRHGNNSTVTGNWFIGNGKPYTGGIRTINAGHKIYNNYFYKLTGTNFRSALAVMNGIPNSPVAGYLQVQDVLISHNTYFDCPSTWSFGVGYGYGVAYQGADRTVRPKNVLLSDNLIYAPNHNDILKFFDTDEGLNFNNNLIIQKNGQKLKQSVSGEVKKSTLGTIDIYTTRTAASRIDTIKTDIFGVTRNKLTIGAFQNIPKGNEFTIANAKNCGPNWYKPAKKLYTNRIIRVSSASKNGLANALEKANNGDVILLSEGVHLITKSAIVAHDIKLKGVKSSKTTIKFESNENISSMFTIRNDARIALENLTIDGLTTSKDKHSAQSVFETDELNALGYSIFMNHCVVKNFVNDNGAILKANLHSLADTISLKNSKFSSINTGLSLAAEHDDTGRYNADHVFVYNCVFSNFGRSVINFYRGGFDESTLEGKLSINHCVFDKTGSKGDSPAINLVGISSVNIANTIFSWSPNTITGLSGSKNYIHNSNFYASKKPILSNGATEKNLLFVASELDNAWQTKSMKLIGKATDKQNIGLINPKSTIKNLNYEN